MSVSRSILFIAEEKTPMVEFILESMRQIRIELYPDYVPVIHLPGQICEDDPGMEMFLSMFLLPQGQTLDYFGGDEVYGSKFKTYNEKFKLWAYMGGSNTTYKDLVTKKKSVYPIMYWRMLMEKIKNSNIKNDVYLTCYNSQGGHNHKSYPALRKEWSGKTL